MAKPAVRVIGTMRRARGVLLCTTALQATACLVLALPVAAQPAPSARPQGGTVVAGSAAIGRTDAATTITQSSNRAAIDWKSFDVGSKQSVNFAQPGATAVTLNRVTGPDPSAIAGHINANGQIIITNKAGVTFYQGAEVNTQSIVVSAPGITNQNFMAGRMVFDQPANPNARVDNRGTITVKQAGLAALVAPSVANSGVINARLGQVVLAGAQTHTLDMYGDGLVSIDVTGQVRQAPNGPDGKPVTALVTNTGLIRADGGVVQLTASAADGIVQTLVRAGGRVQANSVGNRTGRIELTGTGGSVVVEGRVAADGHAPGTTGGTVVVLADGTTSLTSTAHVTASGRAGGGTIALGTTLARARGTGAPPAGTSARTVIAAGARVSADATGAGSGGRVTVLSTQETQIGGTLTARGGPGGGDGGIVELSGAQGFALTGTADTSAPLGKLGTILLDPGDLVITTDNTAPIAPGSSAPNISFTQGGTTGAATVSPAQIQGLSGNVDLQATNNLTVNSSLALTAQGQALTLEAGNNLTVNAGVTVSTMGALQLLAASPNTKAATAGGTLSVLGSLTAGGDITLHAGSGGINLAANVTGTNLIVSTTGPLTQTAGGISVTDLSGNSSSVSLTSRTNVVATVGAGQSNYTTSSTTGDFTLVDSKALTTGAGFAGSGVVVQPGRTISLTTDSLTIGDADDSNPTVDTTGGDTTGMAARGTFIASPFTQGLGVVLTAARTKPTGVLALNLDDLNNTAAKTLQLGALSTAGVPLAGAVTIGQGAEAIDLGAESYTSLVTVASGAVTQGGQLSVASFSGQGGTLNLPVIGNGIDTLAGFTTTAGDLSFHTGQGMAVTGAVSAANGAAAANVSLSSSGGTIYNMVLGANVTGATVSLDSTYNSLQTSGNVTQTGGVITATKLLATGNVVSLPNANPVDSLSTSAAYAGLTLKSVNPLAVVDAVSTTTGAVTLTAPSISQTATSSIAAPVLSGAATTAAFTSRLNQVASVGNFQSPGGSFALTTASPLVVNTINAAGGQITLTADTLGVGAPAPSIDASGGSVTLRPLTAGRAINVATTPNLTLAALSVSQATLNAITTNTLVLGGAGATSAIAIGNANDAITLTGHATTLQLQSAGAVTQGTGATLAVSDLVGSTASLALPDANAITTLGLGNAATGTLTGYATTGALTLNAAGALTLANTVTAGGAVAITAGTGLTTGAAISGTGIALTAMAGNLVQTAGAIATAGTLALTASGAVSQTGGTVSAATLTGSSASLSVPGATVTNLGPYTTTGSFALTNAGMLTIGGTVKTGDASLTTLTGGLALNAQWNAGAVTLGVAGAVTEGAGGTLAATSLTGSAGSVALGSGNEVSTLGNFTSTGGFTLVNNLLLGTYGLAVTGTVTDSTGVTLTTYGPMALSGTVTAPAITLTAASAGTSPSILAPGSIIQSAGALVTGALSGSSAGVATLTSAGNRVTSLGSFSSVGGFALTDGRALTVAGPVTDATSVALNAAGTLGITGTVTTGALSTVATGAITQTGTGVQATSLTGSGASAGFASVAVSTLGAFTTTTGLSLTDTLPLAVTGPVTDGATVALTSSGAVSVAGTITAPLTSLTAGGALTQTAGTITGSTGLTLTASDGISQTGGVISAGTLTGSSGAATALTAAGNSVATLASFTATGGFALTDGSGLTVSGPVTDHLAVSAGPFVGGGITLGVTGALVLGGVVTGPSLATTVSGAITQPGGSLQVGALSGSAASASFGQAGNAITTLTAFAAPGGFALTDSTPLTIGGAVTAGAVATGPAISITDNAPTFGTGGSLSAPGGTVQLAALATAGLTVGGGGTISGSPPVTATTLELGAPTGGPVTITGAFNLSTISVLDLESAGAITETGAGAVAIATLSGHGASAALNGANQVGTLNGFTTTGAFALTNAQTLTVGALTASTATLAVTGGLTFTGAVTAPAQLALTVSGAVTQPSGAISTGLLTGSAGSLALTSATNTVTTLGPFATTGDFTLFDGTGLTVVGAVDPGNVTMNVVGDLTLDSSVTGATVSLTATGAITEGTGGLVDATVLTGSANTANFSTANLVTTLGSFATTAGFALVDAQPLAVTGPVTDPVSVALQSAGTMTLSGTVTSASTSLVATNSTLRTPTPGAILQTAGSITGSTLLTLTATGAISQTGGTITAGTLTGSSGAATALTSAGNSVTTLGRFTSTGGFALTDGRSLSLSGPVTDSASITLGVTGDLALAGTLTAPSLVTTVSGAITQPGGSLQVGALSGSAGSASFGQAVNALTTLGTFTTTAGFALTDGAPLTIAGAVTAGTGQTIAIFDDTPTFGSAGSLTAPGGTVQLAGLAPDGLSVGGGSGISGSPPVTATTLELGAPTSGPVTIAGAFNLASISALDLESAGAITETGAGAVAIATLTGHGASATLNGANQIGTLSGFTTTGAFALTNAQSLTVGALSASTATLAVTGGLAFTGAVTAPTQLALTVSGAVTQPSGAISTALLTGSAGSLALPGATNSVAGLGSFTSTGGFALTDASSLSVSGPVTDGTAIALSVTGGLALAGTVTAPSLVTTVSGAITQPGGSLQVGALSGSAGSASFGQAVNALTTLGAFTTTGGFALTDGVTLTIAGAVTAGTGQTIAITNDTPTFGSAGSLKAPGGTVQLAALSAAGLTVGGSGTISGSPPVTATTLELGAATGGPVTIAGAFNLSTISVLDLESAGAITETGAGAVAIGTLTGHGASATLNGANQIGTLSGFTTTGAFALSNAQSLTVGALSASTATLAVTGGLALTGAVTAPTQLALAVSGAVTQPGGAITTALLSGSAGSLSLASATNAVATLGPFATTGALALTDAQSLTVGTLSASAATLAVTGDLAFTGAVTAPTQLALAVSGAVTQPSGAISTGLLSGSAASLSLVSTTNAIATLGPFTTTGAFALTNAQSLTVGALSASTATLAVTGDLAFTGAVTAPAQLALTVSGAVTQPSGAISTALLTGSAGSLALTSTTNAITTLGPFATTGNFALFDGTGLTVAGAVDAGNVTTNVVGDLTLDSSVTGATVSLTATGAITEGTGGLVDATVLTGSANTANFSTANLVTTLGSFATTAGFALVDAQALAVTGPVTDPLSVALQSAGTMTLSGTVTSANTSLVATNTVLRFEAPTEPIVSVSPAGDILQTAGSITGSTLLTLTATGAISQTGGTITAGTLTGSSGGATALTSAGNSVAILGRFTSTGGFALTDGRSLSLSGPVTDSASITLGVTGDLALAGTLTAPSLVTTVSGAITQPGGSLQVGALSGSAGSASFGQAVNALTTLGTFTTTAGFALTDGAPLTIAGAVTAGTGQTIAIFDDTPTFGSAGSLTAPGGTVQLAGLAPDGLSVGGGSGISGSPPVTATTLELGAPTSGPVTIAGAFNLASISALDLESAGAITETGAGAVAIATLTGHGASATLNGANQIGTLSGFTTTGAFALTNAQSLTVGALSASTATLAVTGGLAFTGAVTAPTQLALTVSGAVTQPSGAISTALLTGSAGSLALPGATNSVAGLGSFTSTGGFALTDASSLSVSGPVTGGTAIALSVTGDLALGSTLTAPIVTTSATGAITEGAGGAIQAATLTGSATTADFSGANLVTALGGFATTAGFALADAQSIAVTGPVTDGATVTLSSTGSLAVSGSIAAPVIGLSAAGDLTQTAGSIAASTTLTLTATGAITQTGGAIAAATLTGSSGGATALISGDNSVASLGQFTSTGALALTDGRSLSLSGPVIGGAGVTLGVTGDLALAGTLTAPALVTTVSGAITQPGGSLQVGALSGSAGSASFGQGGNGVATLGAFTTSAGFVLAGGVPLTIAGAVTAGMGQTIAIIDDAPSFGTGGSLVAPGGTVQVGALSAAGLTVGGGGGITGSPAVTATTLELGTPTGGPVTITGAFNLSGISALDLESAGAITETGAGAIAIATLTGHGASATLNGANQVGTLSGFAITGSFALTNGQSLTVGALSASTASLAVAGDLTLAGTVTAPAQLALTVSGAVTQPSGALSTALLTGSAGSLSLPSAANTVTSLGSFTSTGGFALTNASGLSVGGPVTDGTAITLGVTGDLALAGTLTAPAVATAATGAITEATGGAVDATTLTGSANTADFSGANLLTALGGFSTMAGFALNNAQGLAVTGPVTDAVSVALSSTGLLAVTGTVSAPVTSLTATALTQSAGSITGSTALTLTATAGAISQTGGTLTAGTLTGSSSGATTLSNPANAVATLGSFTSAGGFALTDGTGLSVGGAVSDTSGITLNVTGDLALASTLSAPAVATIASGAITEGAGGLVTATTLTGSANTANFANPNLITSLGQFATKAGFALTNAQALSVTGPVTDGAAITLNSTGPMTVAGTVLAPAVVLSAGSGTAAATPVALTQSAGSITGSTALTLTATGAITQTGGTIIAGDLTGTSGAATTLTSAGNSVAALGSFTSSGGFALNDGRSLSLSGPVTDSAGITLGVTGDLALGGELTAPSLATNVSGAITQPGGSLQVGALAGSAGSASLGQPGNAVATLSAFTTTGGFALTDSAPLTIAGAVTAGTGQTIAITDAALSFGPAAALSAPGGTVQLASASGLTVGGGGGLTGTAPITAATLELGAASGGPVTITGAFNLSTISVLDLESAGAITETGAGAVAVATLTGHGASAALNGANQVGTLNGFTTTGAFALTNAQSLTVGALTAGTATLAVTGDLAFTGAVTAPAQLALTVSGAVTQPSGAISTGLLTGSAGSLALARATNAITTLGPFATTGHFTLFDGTGLTVVGAVDPGNVTINVVGDLTLDSSVTGATVSLTATGAITEGTGGLVNATVLTGSANTANFTGANLVTTLGGFATAAGFTLADAQTLTVTGPVTDGVAVTLSSTGPITVSGTVAAPDTNLTAGGALTQAAGTITGSTALTLNATGAIGQTGGTIAAGTLTGSSGAATTLTSAGNSVTTLGRFTSTGGFALTDGRSLTASGPVTDTTAITLAVTGDLALTGTLTAPSVVTTATGAITQPGGSLQTASLAGSAASANFGQDANAIAALAAFTTAGSFAITDSVPLSINGAVTVGAGQTITIADANPSFAPGGSLNAPGGMVLLQGVGTAPIIVGAPNSLSSTLSATANTLVISSAAGAPISIVGALNLAPTATLDLETSGAVAENGGAIQAGTLTGRASSVALTGANALGTLGPFTSGGAFTLTNAQTLAIGGPLTAGPVTLNVTGDLVFTGNVAAQGLALGVSGAVTQPSGGIVAGQLQGSAGTLSLTGPNQIGALGPFTTTGGLTLNTAQALAVNGALAGGSVTLSTAGALGLAANVTANAVSLTANGPVTQSGGVLQTGTLAAAAADVTLTGANRIGALGAIAAPGTVTLTNAQDLAITGPVSVGTLDATIAGALTQTGGTVSIGTLTGSTASGVSLGTAGSASLAQLGAFSAGGGALSLVDGGALTITGPLRAAALGIAATGQLTLQGGMITTGGSVLQVLADGSGTGRFVQSGTTTVLPLSGTTATLRIDLPAQGGALTLENLFGPSTDLTLSLGGGTATGTLHVADLLVLGRGGRATLSGSVDGQSSFLAAELARIDPGVDTQYTLNNCAIQSVSCTVQSTFLAPQSFLRPDILTLDVLNLSVTRDRDDPTLLLPNISDRDY